MQQAGVTVLRADDVALCSAVHNHKLRSSMRYDSDHVTVV